MLIVNVLVSSALVWFAMQAKRDDDGCATMLVPIVAFVCFVTASVVGQHGRAIRELSRWARAHTPFAIWDASSELAAMHSVAAPVRSLVNCLAIGVPAVGTLFLGAPSPSACKFDRWAFGVGVCFAIGAGLTLLKGYTLVLPSHSAHVSSSITVNRDSPPSELSAEFAKFAFIGVSLLASLAAVLYAHMYIYKELSSGLAFVEVCVANIVAVILLTISIALFTGRLRGSGFERLIVKMLAAVPGISASAGTPPQSRS